MDKGIIIYLTLQLIWCGFAMYYMKKEIKIKNIYINAANLENIAKYNRIRGTLLLELKKCMINIAKWQQERMYSEEDMQEYAEFCIRCDRERLPCIVVKDWFEQFKK
jgi:hypothetical protein